VDKRIIFFPISIVKLVRFLCTTCGLNKGGLYFFILHEKGSLYFVQATHNLYLLKANQFFMGILLLHEG